MKLINALSTKNKLARNIKDIQAKIAKQNSYIKGNTAIYDTTQLLKELHASIDALVAVKSDIARANSSNIESIYRLSELKSLASFLKKLTINEGKVKGDGYNSEVHEWESVLSNRDRDELIVHLEGEIETLQGAMDKFNYETVIPMRK